MGQLGGFPAQSHTMQQAGPAPSASGRFEVEGAGAAGVVALAGWYNAVGGRVGPAGEVDADIRYASPSPCPQG
jgi:hypothetical protein